MADEPVPLENPSDSTLPADPPPPETPEPDRIEGMSKALQKVQQDIAQLTRHAAKQGGELTDEQERKRQQALAESARLKKELETYVSVDDGEEGIDKKLTKSVLRLQERQDNLEAENQNLRSQLEKGRRDPDQAWDGVKKEYPHVDLRTAKAEWTRCVQDAAKSRTVKAAESRLAAGKIDQETFDDIVEKAAQDIFHPWAKSQNDAKKPPTATGPAPLSASGRRSVPIPAAQPHAPALDIDPEMEFIKNVSAQMDKDSGGRVTI